MCENSYLRPRRLTMSHSLSLLLSKSRWTSGKVSNLLITLVASMMTANNYATDWRLEGLTDLPSEVNDTRCFPRVIALLIFKCLWHFTLPFHRYHKLSTVCVALEGGVAGVYCLCEMRMRRQDARFRDRPVERPEAQEPGDIHIIMNDQIIHSPFIV